MYVLISQLSEFNSNETCDSIKDLYITINRSTKGFGVYQTKLLNILGDFNTPKSLKTIAEIISKYKVAMPGNFFL